VVGTSSEVLCLPRCHRSHFGSRYHFVACYSQSVLPRLVCFGKPCRAWLPSQVRSNAQEILHAPRGSVTARISMPKFRSGIGGLPCRSFARSFAEGLADSVS
jgi:hypothetical protein